MVPASEKDVSAFGSHLYPIQDEMYYILHAVTPVCTGVVPPDYEHRQKALYDSQRRIFAKYPIDIQEVGTLLNEILCCASLDFGIIEGNDRSSDLYEVETKPHHVIDMMKRFGFDAVPFDASKFTLFSSEHHVPCGLNIVCFICEHYANIYYEIMVSFIEFKMVEIFPTFPDNYKWTPYTPPISNMPSVEHFLGCICKNSDFQMIVDLEVHIQLRNYTSQGYMIKEDDVINFIHEFEEQAKHDYYQFDSKTENIPDMCKVIGRNTNGRWEIPFDLDVYMSQLQLTFGMPTEQMVNEQTKITQHVIEHMVPIFIELTPTYHREKNGNEYLYDMFISLAD